jgi:hypothetical protein
MHRQHHDRAHHDEKCVSAHRRPPGNAKTIGERTAPGGALVHRWRPVTSSSAGCYSIAVPNPVFSETLCFPNI